jgi:chromosome segregation ATPase
MERLLRESEQGRQKDVGFLRQEIERRDSILKHEINQRDAEIGFLRNEIASRDKEIKTLRNDVGSLRHSIDLKNHELNSIYYSKQWKIASAVKEARHSAGALIKLPFRIIRIVFGR